MYAHRVHDPGLLLAFSATHYCVLMPRACLILRPDTPSPDALSLLREARWSSISIITAHNPLATPATPQANAHAHARLLTLTEHLADRRLPSINRDPSRRWPDEPGLALPDLSIAEATALARSLGQIAFIHATIPAHTTDPHDPPRLVWC